MDDLMGKLQSILSTKEGQSQLNNIASMLNLNGNGSTNKAPESAEPPQGNAENQGGGLDFSAIASMLSGMGSSDKAQDTTNSDMPNIDINMILKLQ